MAYFGGYCRVTVHVKTQSGKSCKYFCLGCFVQRTPCFFAILLVLFSLEPTLETSMKHTWFREGENLYIAFWIHGERLAQLTVYRSTSEKAILHLSLVQFFGAHISASRYYFEGIITENKNPEILDSWLSQIRFGQGLEKKDFIP